MRTMKKAEDQSLLVTFSEAVLWGMRGMGRATGKAVGELPGTIGTPGLNAWPRGFM